MKGNRRSSSRWVVGAGVAMLALAGCSRQEAADWKQATLADSAEAYQLFLQEHPHSAETAQAQTRIQQLGEQRDWQIASAADTRDSYQLFLSQHPDSKWAQEARIRIENFAQAGVSGGPALAAAAAPASANGESAAEAAANDASAAQGIATGGAGIASATAAPASTAAAPAVSSGAAASVADASVAPAVAARHGLHRDTLHRDVLHRAHTQEKLAHAARPATHRVARAESHHATPLLQLGAFHSRASAESEWRVLSAHNASLKGLHPRYVAARSRSGRVYRLQVRVSSAAEASGVCASLRRHARSCVRVIA